MTFRPKHYSEERAKRTPAQERATSRNFKIFRLHGLHSAMSLLSEPRRTQARSLVDLELKSMGANPTFVVKLQREIEIRKNLLRELENDRA